MGHNSTQPTNTALNAQWVQRFEKEMQNYYSKNSVNCFKTDIWHFAQYLGDSKNLSAVDFEDLAVYMEYLAQLTDEAGNPTYKQTTLNRNRASLVTFYNFLINEGVIEHNPATDLKSVTVYKKGVSRNLEYFTSDEAKELLRVIREERQANRFSQVRDLVFIHFMLTTGICMNELAILTLDQIDFENHRVKVMSRDGEERIISYPSALDPELEAYFAERAKLTVTSDLFIISNRGTQISVQNGNATLRKYAKMMNLGRKVSNIALRHTFAIQLIQMGVAIEEVSKLLGNRSVQYTTRLYQEFLTTEAPNYAELFTF